MKTSADGGSSTSESSRSPRPASILDPALHTGDVLKVDGGHGTVQVIQRTRA